MNSSNYLPYNPIVFFNEQINDEAEEIADKFCPLTYSSTISFTHLHDNGWKLNPHSETNSLTNVNFASSSIFFHFLFVSSDFSPRNPQSSVNKNSLLFFIASSLWIKLVLIFATSVARSEARSASLSFFLQYVIWHGSRFLERDGDGEGWNRKLWISPWTWGRRRLIEKIIWGDFSL